MATSNSFDQFTYHELNLLQTFCIVLQENIRVRLVDLDPEHTEQAARILALREMEEVIECVRDDLKSSG